jgi:hypothetical protein
MKYAGLRNGKIVEFSNDRLSLNHDHIDQIVEIELNTNLSEDILYSISCIQDYRDTIDINSELWHEIGERIERLFKFYYQLVGFNDYR